MLESGYLVLSASCYIDLKKGVVVSEDGKLVSLPIPKRAFMVLMHLARHEGSVLPKDDIIDAVWGSDYDGDAAHHSLANAVAILRAYDVSLDQAIHTIRGVGYKFERSYIYEIKNALSDNSYSETEKRSLLEKYLNTAVSERILRLEDAAREILSKLENAVDVNLPDSVVHQLEEELDLLLKEHKTLKDELYSDEAIVRILREGNSEAPSVPNSSLCAVVSSELEELERKIETLKKLKQIVC